MTGKEVIKSLLIIVPEFMAEWEEYLDYWDGEDAGLSNDFAEFASYFIENIDEISTQKRLQVFILVENCFLNGDYAVKDAIATCFLEVLLNATSSQQIESSKFVDLLGFESKKYCRQWDKFTGCKTKGL
ncbi:hypothetical protein ACGRSR_22670 [Vibrio owensii]|uniref:DUF7674 family protein n=1 Tax=Vibrio owensii TaxID=696485 RepID=UPI00374A5C1B